MKTTEDYEKVEIGLNEQVIRHISKEKGEPDWVLDIRLKALSMFNKIDLPDWGPDLKDIDLNKLITYIKPKNDMKRKWEDVPEDIKNVFDKLGIPEAEKKSLSGVGAQYDSEMFIIIYKMKLRKKVLFILILILLLKNILN